MDAQALERELAAKAVAPRVTLDQVEDAIASCTYLAHETLTICVLTLRNGFKVTGESACADPANFDAEVGKRLARAQAVNKIWPLLGYQLKDRLLAQLEQQLRDEDPVGQYDVDAIAFICHEVNRAYCAALGDTSQPAWADAPDWQKDSARNGVRMHLTNPDAGPEESHRNWYAEKLQAGWKYGPVKDPEKKEHPCMVSFEELPREQQAKDWIFRAVVHSMAELA